MLAALSRLFRPAPQRGGAPDPVDVSRPDVFAPRPEPAGPSQVGLAPAFAAARELPDGTPCDAALMDALNAEIASRRAAAGLEQDPPPRLTGLQVRRSGVPDWWEAKGCLFLCAPDARPVELSSGFLGLPCESVVAVVGSCASVTRLSFVGAGALVAVGDGVFMNLSTIAVTGRSTVLIGEGTTATWMASIDARNGGFVQAGADNMWAAGVNVMTDDSHAVRDARTGERLNRFGGRVVTERHVWVGQQTQLMGDCRIGHDVVVGQGAFVKNRALPPNSICVGRPARAIRSGVTWSREDLP